MRKSFVAKFIKKEKIAKDTYSFYFEKDKSFNFIPGEYIRLSLAIDKPDNRGSSRYFTIAASPLDSEIIITTRVIRSAFKKKLLSLSKGEGVTIFGSMGNFVVSKSDKKTKVFLSGGIGITTFYSMIKFYSEKTPSFKIILIASFSKPEDIIYLEEFRQIEKKHSFLKVIYTVTSGSTWDGERGRIDGKKIKKYVPDLLDSTYYLVGPESMVESIKTEVEKLGVPLENIERENFTGY